MEEYNIYLFFYKRDFNIIKQIYNDYELVSLTDEVMLSKLDPCIESSIDDSEWVHITGIQDFINLGKINDKIYISIYYEVKNSMYTTITMTFTYDDCMIIGFFIPVESISDDEYKRTVINLKKKYKADMLSVFFEEPPPFSEHDFIKKSNLKGAVL